MNGQPSPNQGGIAQLAGGMGSMGGSPTLGGAPQTPPMPQGGAQQPPQPTPQGGLPPDLLKALAAAKVKKMQDAAKRELELQMAQQQAASGEGNKTVVQQLQEGVEKDTAQEMMQALSGGIKQAGQMSAQPQGQPMSSGIAAAPGANQAAQPEAMAAGGIVAFKEGDKVEGEDDQPVDAYNRASNETWLGQGIRRGKAAVKDVAGLLSLRPWATDPERVAKGDTRTNAEVEGYTPEGYKVNDRADQLKAAFDRQQAARPVSDERPATTSFDPMNPWANVGKRPAATLQDKPGNMDDPALVRREDMRRGIANVQRPPVAAIQQTQRPPAAAPNLNIQTNPNYAPPAAAGDAGGLSGLVAEQLKNRIGAKPEDAEAAAIKKYKDLMAVDPELAAQLKADNARVRATAESKGAAPTWQESLYAAMPKGRPQPGSSVFTTIGNAVGGINALELQRKGEKEAAEKELLGMSKAEYDKQQGEKEKLYGVGTAANKTAQEAGNKAMEVASHVLNTQSVADTARLTRQSEEKIAAERNALMEKIARINAAVAHRPDISARMQAELEKAKTPEDVAAITKKYDTIVKTINPNKLDAPSKELDPMQLMLIHDMIKDAEKSGDTKLANSLRKRLGDSVGGDNLPSAPPPGAVKKIG